MNRHQKKLLEILSFSLYSESLLPVSDSILKSASWHDILPLISDGNDAISVIANNVYVLGEQDEICSLINELQYAVVGGSASAIYYANPIKKTLRNIEIISKNPDCSNPNTFSTVIICLYSQFSTHVLLLVLTPSISKTMLLKSTFPSNVIAGLTTP